MEEEEKEQRIVTRLIDGFSDSLATYKKKNYHADLPNSLNVTVTNLDNIARPVNQVQYNLTGILSPIAIAGYLLFTSLTLGPLDTVRWHYNRAIGDSIAFKSQLLDVSKREIVKGNKKLTKEQVESRLAKQIEYPYEGKRIDPESASIECLFDAAEENTELALSRYIWTIL